MKSAIYIAQEHIEVVGYVKQSKSLRILDYAFAPLPERTMINGNIAEAPTLVEHLMKLKMQKPKLFTNVSLVIDSTSLSVKEIPAPKLNKRQYMKIIRDELTINAQDEMVIDYTLVQKKDNKRVLFALSTGKAFITSYLDVFKAAGIKLETIRVGLETIIAYIKTQTELKDRTFVLNIVDGISMLSVVFSNGENVFSTRSRLAFEDEMGLMQSVADNLRPLTQFMKSEKLPEIEKSYYLGLTDKQIAMLSLHGDNMAGFDLFGGPRRARKVTDLCHLAYMCPFNENGIDLLESYKNIKKNMREHKQVSRLWLLPVAGALIVAAAYLLPTMLTKPILEEITKLERYLHDPETISGIEAVDELSAATSAMAHTAGDMNAAVGMSELYARLTNELIDLIMRTDESVIIESFRIDANGSIAISGSSDTEFDSARYVRMLNSNELIGWVDYTGYRYDNAGRYRFSLQAVLPVKEEEVEEQ